MEIHVRKKGEAMLFTFHTKSKAFASPSERNRFFSGLYGRKQIVRRSGKEYIYRRRGLLDTIPYIKVDDSVFIVSKSNARKIIRFFERWQDKIEFNMFTILMDEQKLKKLCGKCRRVKIE